MLKNDLIRLRHMLDAAREAVGYAQGRKREDLQTDRPLAHSLVRCLEIIGEAANKISPEYRRDNPTIQWDDMVGMRNRLIHAYFDVNLDIVWQTASKELPLLIDQAAAILESENISES